MEKWEQDLGRQARERIIIVLVAILWIIKTVNDIMAYTEQDALFVPKIIFECIILGAFVIMFISTYTVKE